MLSECWGDRLKYNLITLQPELDGEAVDPFQLELLYVLLSKIGWTVDKHKSKMLFYFQHN